MDFKNPTKLHFYQKNELEINFIQLLLETRPFAFLFFICARKRTGVWYPLCLSAHAISYRNAAGMVKGVVCSSRCIYCFAVSCLMEVCARRPNSEALCVIFYYSSLLMLGNLNDLSTCQLTQHDSSCEYLLPHWSARSHLRVVRLSCGRRNGVCGDCVGDGFQQLSTKIASIVLRSIGCSKHQHRRVYCTMTNA